MRKFDENFEKKNQYIKYLCLLVCTHDYSEKHNNNNKKKNKHKT